MLRPYQQAAHVAAISFIKTCLDPCIIEAATGAGKSHIISAIANTIREISGGKHVLCIAPSAELVIQNREKMLATGNPASIFSASAGGTCLKHPIVFGTPVTIKNKIHKFGDRFACVIIDECHGVSNTIKTIISELRERNPKLRVIGLTATPYRMNQGYIFNLDENGNKVESVNPYFMKRVYSITAPELIGQGFLTPPVAHKGDEHYDTLAMQLNAQGKFDQGDIDRAYHGHGRKTAKIIEDVVNRSRYRQGVMIFAASIQHAIECLASLPPELSAIVTGDTPKDERARILTRFKAREIKYLVNVSVLTTGFDAPHVDVVAILRATESLGLFQQIIGRGLRIDDGKEDCLILDYAENIDRHCPDGDLFAPMVKTGRQKSGDAEPVEAECESCSHINKFSARPNDGGYEVDAFGYFVDYEGDRIETDFGFLPAHFGRRCENHSLMGGQFIRCHQRWSFKNCPECDAENDIAARRCCSCKAEIVDPNEKLRMDFKLLKKDPSMMQCDVVKAVGYCETMSKAGNECMRMDFVTEYRKFSFYITKKDRRYPLFLELTQGFTKIPRTVTYKQNAENKFYTVFGFDKPEDVLPVK